MQRRTREGLERARQQGKALGLPRKINHSHAEDAGPGSQPAADRRGLRVLPQHRAAGAEAGRSDAMTNEEKDLLIAYLVDAGEIDPDGDVEAEFLDWHRVREGVVSGETHYKAVLEAARVRKRSSSAAPGSPTSSARSWRIRLKAAVGSATTRLPAAARPRDMRPARRIATRGRRWTSPGCADSWTTCTGRRKKREVSGPLNPNMVNPRQRSSPWRHISTMTVPR